MFKFISKFFEGQEKKKVVCEECRFCKVNTNGESICHQPSRIDVEKNYITGRLDKTYSCCYYYNTYGQCKKFEPKEKK